MKGFVFSTIIVLGAMSDGFAQDKREMKVEVKKTMNDEGTSIHLRIEKEDGTVYEKTYASEEEMKNDPELEDIDINMGGGESVFIHSGDHKDGKIEIIMEGEEGEQKKKVMMFKSDDGELHEMHEGANVWIEEFEGAEGENTFIFTGDEGNSYKIIKGEDGEIDIEKNGEPVNIEELKKDGNTKVDIEEDGLIVIKEGDNISKIRIDNHDGNFEKLGEDGEHVFIFKKDGDTDPKIVELDDGNYTIEVTVDSEMDEDGNNTVVIHEKMHHIVVELVDIKNLNEISEIPGVHLNDGKQLDLQEVDYYPNPSEGQFTLRFTGKKVPTEVKIIDMMGQEVYRENINDFGGSYNKQIDLSEKDAGVYILQVVQNDKSWSKKVVVE
jgi:hypothetical protein